VKHKLAVAPDSSHDDMLPALEQAVHAFGEALMIIRVHDQAVEWLSQAAAALFYPGKAKLAAGTLVADDPALTVLLPVLETSTERTAVDLAGQRYVCTKKNVSVSQVALRFVQAAPAAENLQRYLEEREKLFTTSRTISVSEMATTLAHEINQPIGSIANIINGTRSRLQKTDCDDAILQALDRAQEQTRFASRIIARIRDFTQARTPARVDCDLKTLLAGSVGLLDWVIGKAHVNIELVLPAEPLIINGDATMLQQVFTNLIRNAVEAMGETASLPRDLRISVVPQDSDIRVEFADSGHGLSDADEQNLFVPFATRKAQGMGVGLNICRSFVELHQGRLWLMPNEHGGCTACVVLPAVATPESVADPGNSHG